MLFLISNSLSSNMSMTTRQIRVIVFPIPANSEKQTGNKTARIVLAVSYPAHHVLSTPLSLRKAVVNQPHETLVFKMMCAANDHHSIG